MATPTKSTPKADEPADTAPDSKTEKEKATKPDPVGKPKDPEKAELTEIPANEPYPTGSPPDPDAAFEQAHGFKRAPKTEE